MSDKVKINDMAKFIMEGLQEYAEVADDEMKAAVKRAGKTIKDEIKANAPKRTGAYSKSWTVKTTGETSHSLHVTVYSKNRYQLAHLLEHGHAKRGGGRVKGQPHITPAEEVGVKELEAQIERALN